MDRTAPRMDAVRSVRGRRRQELANLALVAGVVALLGVVAKLTTPLFSFWGDNAESFFPLWHHLGTELRSGHWIGMEPAGWAGGNLAAEAAYGIYNPVTLGSSIALSSIDDLARAGFLLTLGYLVILGTGVYLVCRSYGATGAPSILMGAVVPFAGFTLFYGANNWVSGLAGLAWVVHFWSSARAHATGRIGPLPAVVTGALAVTVGNPYSLLGVVVILAALALELAVQKRWRRLASLVIVGLSVGAFTALVYGTLIETMPVTLRGSSAGISNTGYLRPSLGDLIGLSSASLQPQLPAWGSNIDKVPSAYLAWFVLPVLPWVRWRVCGGWRSRASLLAAITIFLLLTTGPETIWLFRWPLRLIEYLYVGLAAALALLLSRGLARDHVRRRATASASVVVFGAYLAWAARPEWIGTHAAVAAATLGLVALAALAYRRWELRGAAAVGILGTGLLMAFQVPTFAWVNQTVNPTMDLPAAHALPVVRESTESYRGTVLQIANDDAVTGPETVQTGRLTFGNTLAAAGITSVNRYTGIGFQEFAAQICLSYRGATCPEALARIHAPVGDGYDASLADAMGIDTVVVGVGGVRGASGEPIAPPPPGWHLAYQDADRQVLLRDVPLPQNDVATGSPGVSIEETSRRAGETIVSLEAPLEGGTFLLDRLAWPGYEAAIDGVQVDAVPGPAGLLEVAVPAGRHEVAVAYRTPGLRLGITLAAAAGAVALVHALAWRLTLGRSTRRVS